ncbi:MAG: hypothetical protein WBN04_03455, partial [Paracoccaceae bacterium]
CGLPGPVASHPATTRPASITVIKLFIAFTTISLVFPTSFFLFELSLLPRRDDGVVVIDAAPLRTGEALADDARGFVDEDPHVLAPVGDQRATVIFDNGVGTPHPDVSGRD